MDPNVNLEQQYQQSQQPYPNQGMPIGNQQYNNYSQMQNMNVSMNANVDIQSNFISKVALVLSVISWLCCCISWLFSIPAMICAVIALIKNKKDTSAWAAIVIAGISLVFYVLATITGMLESVTEGLNATTNTTENGIVNDSIEKEINTSTVENSNEQINVNTTTPSKQEVKYEITDTQFYTFVNSIGTGEYFFLMEVENTGDCDLYLAECEVDLEDSNGHLLQTGDTMSNCPSIIKPGEKGYFYNGALDSLIDDNVNVADVATAVPHVEIEVANGERIEYPTSDLSMSEENGYAKVVGRITNNTNADDSGVYVNVIFYNIDGKVIGITGTSVYDIKAGETKGFDCSSMFMTGEAKYSDITEYKVIAQKDYWQW